MASETDIMGGISMSGDLYDNVTSHCFNYNPYSPIQMDPAGRNYRPDQFNSSIVPFPGYNPYTYSYPKFDPTDPVNGIVFETEKVTCEKSPKQNTLEDLLMERNLTSGRGIERFSDMNKPWFRRIPFYINTPILLILILLVIIIALSLRTNQIKIIIESKKS